MTEYVGAVGIAARDAKPQDVHRCAVILTVQTRPVAHDRVTPIAANHEIGVNGQFSIGRVGANADDAAPLFDQVGRLCPHVQIKLPVAAAVLGQKIQKIPLRHKRNIFALRR